MSSNNSDNDLAPGLNNTFQDSPSQLQFDVFETTAENDADFDKISWPEDPGPSDEQIRSMLGYFLQKTYNANELDPRAEAALDFCQQVLEKEYDVFKVDNKCGRLSHYYPVTIPFILGEIGAPESERKISPQGLVEIVNTACLARCRGRFPVPVIMYNNNFICRSSTVATDTEMFVRNTWNAINNRFESNENGDDDNTARNPRLRKSSTEIQGADVVLLQKLNVTTIVDLMVENRKIKFGLPVTSSEKVHSNAEYCSNFKLQSMPFPGCEFFKKFYDNSFTGQGLYFDWPTSMCDAPLSIIKSPVRDFLNIRWEDYKKWDIVQITQNYLKFIIGSLRESGGILIHCISGWDRTPLFICLIRLSLWADGVIHKNLSPKEMLYFTLAYDWMLFGHNFPDRISKNEHILLFCFYSLKHIFEDEFSVFNLAPPEQQNTDIKKENVEGPPSLNEDAGTFEMSKANDAIPTEFESSQKNDNSQDSMDSSENLSNFDVSKVSEPININPVPNSVSSTGSWINVNYAASVEESISQTSSDGLNSQTTVNLSRKEKLDKLRGFFYIYFYNTIREDQLNYKYDNYFMSFLKTNMMPSKYVV
ncbi:myotubularin-related protein 14 [Tenebrio molitor]|uniref:myotubularin-related protein 14 n=1 Tax=Tenebrio molitor TaxID=7067 RepID=UPI001C397E9A|nr:unnamed protein product [Tenebrio molitor]